MAPSSFGAGLTPIDPRDPGEMERAIAAFAREPNGGLIVTSSQGVVDPSRPDHLACMRYRLPNIQPFRYFTASGALASYGPDPYDLHRRAAGYVDRILKGEKPADQPVQAPSKYELVINLTTAKVLGLVLPPQLLATADELIE